MRYRLRTLLMVLALGPPLLAAGWWIVRDENRRKVVFDLAADAPLALSGMVFVVGFIFAFAYVAASIAGAITGKR